MIHVTMATRHHHTRIVELPVDANCATKSKVLFNTSLTLLCDWLMRTRDQRWYTR